jgi:hypothetical protein
MPRSPFALSLVAGVVLALVLAVFATAQQPPQRGWQTDVVRVADRSGWDATVKHAVQQWNAARVGVTFRLVDPNAPAEVRVVADPARLQRYCRTRGCEAFASTVGPSRRVRTDVVLDRPAGYERTTPTASDVRLVVHELGHTLGLQHEHRQRCAVMQPDVALAGCGARGGVSGDEGPPVCGPFAPDVRKAVALYGGKGIARPHCVAALTP